FVFTHTSSTLIYTLSLHDALPIFACGNKAVQTNIKYADIKFNFSSIMDDIAKEVRFGVGKSSLQKRNHEVLEDSDWEVFKEIGNHEHDQLKSLARKQLGTAGSG